MTLERKNKPDPSEQERHQDLEWIQENQILFWLVASTAFEEIGFGALVVDLISEPVDQGHPFSYYAEGELEIQDQSLHRHLREYDPSSEFIVVLLKADGQTSICRGARPSIGWMADLKTQTRHGDNKEP